MRQNSQGNRGEYEVEFYRAERIINGLGVGGVMELRGNEGTKSARAAHLPPARQAAGLAEQAGSGLPFLSDCWTYAGRLRPELHNDPGPRCIQDRRLLPNR